MQTPVPQSFLTAKVMRRTLVLLLGLVLWLGLFLTLRPLSLPDEGRYGDISRWMLNSGDWLVPRINGVPFFHKPPLLHWLTTAALSVFGLHNWVLRLIPALAGLSMLGSMLWFLNRQKQPKLAEHSVLILATSILFFGAAQYVNHDLLVACFISLTILGFADYILTLHKSSLYVGYIACALGFLSKGLIGVLLPGMVILIWIISIQHWKMLYKVFNPVGFILFAAIALPWIYAVAQHYPNFLHYFFIEQQFDRFSGQTFNNKQPWFFYIACLIISFIFWIMALASKSHIRHLLNYNRASFIASQPTNHNIIQFPQQAVTGPLLNRVTFKTYLAQPLNKLYWIWLLSILVFFSIPQSKLAGYILPVVMPLAIIIAQAFTITPPLKPSIDTVNPSQERKGSWRSIITLAVVSGLLILTRLLSSHIPHLLPEDAVTLGDIGAVLGLMAALLSGLIKSGLGQPYHLNAFKTAFICSASFCIAVTVAVSQINHKHHVGETSFAAEVTPATRLVFYRTYPYDIPWLLNTKTMPFVVQDWSQMTTDSVYQNLLEGLHFEPQLKPYFWEEIDFNIALQHASPTQPLMILAEKNTVIPALKGLAPTYRYAHLDVYRISTPIFTLK